MRAMSCVSCAFGTVRDEKVEKVSKVEFYDLMTTYAKVLALTLAWGSLKLTFELTGFSPAQPVGRHRRGAVP